MNGLRRGDEGPSGNRPAMTQNYVWACNVGGYVSKGASILQSNSQGSEAKGGKHEPVTLVPEQNRTLPTIVVVATWLTPEGSKRKT